MLPRQLDIPDGDAQTAKMSARSRDVFPLRFKNPHTRAALKHLSEQTGVSMTDIAERAVEHELVLQGADLERRLSEALIVVRDYQPSRDGQAYVELAATGERGGLDPFRDVRAAHHIDSGSGREADPFGVLAAFKR